MAKKVVYLPAEEVIRLGRGKPPEGGSTYTEVPPYPVDQRPSRCSPAVRQEGAALATRSRDNEGRALPMIVRELTPPYREARIAILFHALDVPWLREKGELVIIEDLVYADGKPVARIVSYRRSSRSGYGY